MFSRAANSVKNYYFLVFILIYSLISLVNHFFYRTYALDLGLYNNAIWDYAHFRFNDCTVVREAADNLLADHFDLILVLISPFVYIFGSYTLLIFQIFIIYLGGLGVQKFLEVFTNNNKTANIGRLFFYLHFGVFAALSFDYHSNVVAACLFPWFVYFVYTGKKIRTGILLALILFSKESTALWMFSGCILLPFVVKREKTVFFTCAAISFAYFLLVTLVIIPAISETGKFHHFKYSVLGNDYIQAISALFMEPQNLIKNLFVNHTTDATGNYVKLEFWLFFLISGGFIMLLRPLWMLMLLPVFFQKLFHDQVQMWGVNSQYSIELVPFMAMGIFSYPYIYKEKSKFPVITNSLIILFTLGVTIRLMDNTVTHVPKENLRIYKSAHYSFDFDKTALNKAIEKIPDTAAVSCQSFIVPHLAFRDKIYQFPLVKDAQYILLVDNNRTYPLDKWMFKDELLYYLNRRVKYEVAFAGGNVYLFYKR
jgi:uncharacterized membrane protein